MGSTDAATTSVSLGVPFAAVLADGAVVGVVDAPPEAAADGEGDCAGEHADISVSRPATDMVNS
jgi:hypothetical protein